MPVPLRRWAPRSIAAIFSLIIAIFVVSGDWSWIQAWIYVIAFEIIQLVNMAFLRNNPELYEERARPSPDSARWDKVLSRLVSIGGTFSTILISAADHRFGWSSYNSVLSSSIGFIFLLVGGLLGVWALSVNRWFSAVVRIQAERGHRVVRDGPYRLVRHPSYFGGILFYFGTVLLLDSIIGLIPAVLTFVALVIRAYLEDRFLQENLPGYKDYAREVRQRLIPLIW